MNQPEPIQKSFSDISLPALVAANILPIFGVLFWGWDTLYIVSLYWAENIVIGFYNIFKIAFARGGSPRDNFNKLSMIPFFIVHYGGFVFVHGVFVFTIFGKNQGGNFAKINVLADMIYAIAALVLSHGVSFVRNYILTGEYLKANPKDLMTQPYSRIVVMHIAIIAGALLSQMLKSPVGVLIVLIALKTIVDIKLHKRSHKKYF